MPPQPPSGTFDLCVVGAGPAGATLARLCAQKGMRVALLERSRLPRIKPCGGAVTGRALALLPRGVLPPDATRPRTLTIGLGAQEVFRTVADPPPMSVVRREDLDAALVQAAVAAGAQVWDGCAFKGLVGTPGRLTASLSHGSLRCAVVAGADGARSQVARALGLPPPTTSLVAFESRVAFSGADPRGPFADHARFDFAVPARPPGYSWVFPRSDHLSVGVPGPLPRGTNAAAAVRGYLARLGAPIPARIEPARGGAIPCGLRARTPLTTPLGLLLGDAAGAADPLTGEGIHSALLTASLAAEAIGSGDFAHRYQETVRAELVPELAWARHFAALLYGPAPLGAWALRRAGQRLGEAHLRIVTGHTTYRAAGSHAVWRVAALAR